MIAKFGFRKADVGNAGPQGLKVAARGPLLMRGVVCSLVGGLVLLVSLGFNTSELWAYAFIPVGVLMIWLFRKTLTMPGSVFHRSTYLLGSRQCAGVVAIAMLARSNMQLLELVFHALPACLIFAVVTRSTLRGLWRANG